MALRRLTSLKRHLQRDDVFREGYVNAVQSYIEKGYCRRIPTDEVSTNTMCYLPHHAVINPRKPGKVRVVFDCAAKWQDVSLIDVLLHGPDLANSLVGMLTRFRMLPVAVVADVQEMFHRVRVKQSACDVLRFVWWPNGDLTKDPFDYRMVVHLFGSTCSPSIANLCLKRVAKDHGREFDPEAGSIVLNNFYVDVSLVSFRDDEKAMKMVSQISSMLVKCGFKLKKWLSNCQIVLGTIPEAERSQSVELELNSSSDLCERVVGVHWNVNRDAFGFKTSAKQNGNVTKSTVLPTICSLYDTLVFFCPSHDNR